MNQRSYDNFFNTLANLSSIVFNPSFLLAYLIFCAISLIFGISIYVNFISPYVFGGMHILTQLLTALAIILIPFFLSIKYGKFFLVWDAFKLQFRDNWVANSNAVVFFVKLKQNGSVKTMRKDFEEWMYDNCSSLFAIGQKDSFRYSTSSGSDGLIVCFKKKSDATGFFLQFGEYDKSKMVGFNNKSIIFEDFTIEK